MREALDAASQLIARQGGVKPPHSKALRAAILLVTAWSLATKLPS